jgi:hypothetical protein
LPGLLSGAQRQRRWRRQFPRTRQVTEAGPTPFRIGPTYILAFQAKHSLRWLIWLSLSMGGFERYFFAYFYFVLFFRKSSPRIHSARDPSRAIMYFSRIAIPSIDTTIGRRSRYSRPGGRRYGVAPRESAKPVEDSGVNISTNASSPVLERASWPP